MQTFSENMNGRIIFHFDVESHSIPLNQFIDTALSTKKVIDDFNHHIFDNKLEYELVITAPERGSLLEIFEVVVTGGCIAGTIGFLSTDIGIALTKGLTGHEPKYWAEKLGIKIKELSIVAIQELKDTDKKKLLNIIIPLMITGFLQTDTETLEKIDISTETFRNAYEARNKIYTDCIDNQAIKGLGFDESEHFSLSRADFRNLIVELPEINSITSETSKKQESWKIDIVDIEVYSPNWKREKGGRKWQGNTKNIQSISFSIEDSNFWELVENHKITPSTLDNMRVQWKYLDNRRKPIQIEVLKVIKYNNTEISNPLSDKEIANMINNLDIARGHQELGQLSLFSDADNKSL